MKVTIADKTVEVNRIHITAKCSDLCFAVLKNNETVVAEHNGYVPALMPEEHYGDYVDIEIDLETGKILNWKRPSIETVEKTKWEIQ